jgi:hypothetical protein
MLEVQVQDDVKHQILRMAGLRGWPRDYPEAQVELIRVACANADRIETLIKTVDGVMNNWDRCPYPSELATMCFENSAHKQHGCAACNWTGWRIIQRGENSGAEKCSCRP